MTSVLLLGESAELTAAFRRLGVTVHTAPADTAGDGKAVRGLVGRHGCDVVVPLTEHVDVAALQALEEGGVTVVPSARGCELTVTRDRLRRTANEDLGLPTTAYAFADTREELTEAVAEMGLPCIVKPASFGSGHAVVRSGDDIDAAWTGGRVMVERFVDFDHELTMLAVRSIDPDTGRLATWFCEPLGHTHSDGRLAAAWQPLAVDPGALENARSLTARITNALCGRGLYAVEMFVAGEDVYFSAVTPRPHEIGVVTLGTQRFSQWDLHARAILGLPIDTTLVTPGACAPFEGTPDTAGLAAALAVPESDLRMYGPDLAEGVALATAETVDEARHRVARMVSALG